ncbi:Dihydropteroate synthase-like protein [Phakopsora pachyrhizi]|nr:Dihydropteroate synthase-like protein [Phakopsora pachyrhizi]
MYLIDQPKFLNAACKISTPLNPLDLLKTIKRIEEGQGRIISQTSKEYVPNGPRPIDLDILLYNQNIIDLENLKIPHVGLNSREFVLRPLNDISGDSIHPVLQKPISLLLSELKRLTGSSTSSSDVKRIHPISFPGYQTLELTKRTHLMSIVNCTPDSFSDPGKSFSLNDAITNSLRHVEQGADIIDIGGMSTRPNAMDVPIEEEIRRTVPVIEALRRDHHLKAHISIDTFRSETAEAAVRAGATIINDVSGGMADPRMSSTVARLGVPYVMMHMRGDPKTMVRMSSYEQDDVLGGVRRELRLRLKSSIEAGIKRWNVILDPGIGFAKDLRGNCILIDSLDKLCPDDDEIHVKNGSDERWSPDPLKGLPILVGPSRKRFIGQLLSQPVSDHQPEKDRLMGTVAVCVESVLKGARIIRVHDTLQIKQAIQVIDGIRKESIR